jgi:hypothetical protein
MQLSAAATMQQEMQAVRGVDQMWTKRDDVSPFAQVASLRTYRLRCRGHPQWCDHASA